MFGETGRERKQDGGFKERRKLEAMRKTGPDKQGVVKNETGIIRGTQVKGKLLSRLMKPKPHKLASVLIF